MKNSLTGLLLFLLCAFGFTHARAEDIVFPADVGVINVKAAPYNAYGDGIHDDTAAIQAALTGAANSRRIVYLPNGTYLLTSTLLWPAGQYIYGLVNLQGESTAGTILRLKDSTFTSSASPLPVIGCGAHGSADYFSNSLRNLTVSTGSGNSGAIGVQFFSNNMGNIRDVAILSEDGQGVTGLDLAYNDQNGPLLIKNVSVSGFGYGVKTGNVVNSQTFEHITVSNQTIAGFYNGGQCVGLRDLTSVNTVPALVNAGFMALLDSSLTGGSSANAAITDSAYLFARNITTAGYNVAIKNTATGGTLQDAVGPNVTEFVSHSVLSLFPSPAVSLNLEIKETPDVPWDALSSWANAVTYGADPTGNNDSTAGIQAAIDSGKTTVYLPNGNYKISATILIRNQVQRIIGCQAFVDVPQTVSPGFKLIDGSGYPGTVVFERIDSGYTSSPTIQNDSSRTLVLKDGTNISGTMTGTGDTFIEDITSNPYSSWSFSGGGHIWARQLNPENDGTKIINTGATLWILGLKTERGGTLIDTEAGGKTELAGGLSYTTTAPGTRPMFINNESSLSVTLGEVCFSGTPFTTLVQETRGGVTRTLSSGGSTPGWINGSALPLYTGYIDTAPAPDFSLSADPSSVSVTQGQSGTSTVSVSPVNGFSDGVTLAASDLPSGVTASFDMNPTTDSSIVTFAADSTAVPGTFTVTITGTSGSLTHSTTLVLTVTADGTGDSVLNSSFETPAVTSAVTRPIGASWIFDTRSGIARSGYYNQLTYNPVPDGVQCAFLQTGGNVSQRIPGFAARKTYTLKARAAQSDSSPATAVSAASVKVYLDRRLLATWKADLGYNDYGKAFVDHAVTFTTTAGSHTLRFVNAIKGIMLIDKVRIQGLAAAKTK